jgi:hypothetical protein
LNLATAKTDVTIFTSQKESQIKINCQFPYPSENGVKYGMTLFCLQAYFFAQK